METKLCSRCGNKKLLSEFHRDRHSSSGRKSRCAECEQGQKREKRYKEQAIQRFRDEGVAKHVVTDETILCKTKTCTLCGETKEQRDFYYRKKLNKFESRCKVCHQAKNRECQTNRKLNKIKGGA